MTEGKSEGPAASLNPSAAAFTFKATAPSFTPGSTDPRPPAGAAPFYPRPQAPPAEPEYHGYGELDECHDHAQEDGVDLPKTKSVADLGLDSLGFVSDDESGHDTPSPMTQIRRQQAMQRNEGDGYDNGGWYDGKGVDGVAAEWQHTAYQSHDQHPGYEGAQQYQVGDAAPYSIDVPHYPYYPAVGVGGAGGFEEYDEGEFLTFLQESFPGYSLDSLRELLEANIGDASLTVEMLLEMHGEVEPPEPPRLDDESSFPTLGGGKSNGASESQKPADLKPPEEMFKSFTISGGRSNLSMGARMGGNDNTSGSGDFAERLRTAQQSARVQSRGSTQVGYGAGSFSGRRTAAEQQWVDTGETVSLQYATTREDARDYMRLRNVCFQQATQAYLSGNKALAKDLSRQGRQHAMNMTAAHESAAAAIFQERNNRGDRGGTPLLDLHGLHVAEAINVLRRELPNFKSSGRMVHILVGTGHHTKERVGGARLPSAVADYLQNERGIRYWEPQPGMLEVTFN